MCDLNPVVRFSGWMSLRHGFVSGQLICQRLTSSVCQRGAHGKAPEGSPRGPCHAVLRSLFRQSSVNAISSISAGPSCSPVVRSRPIRARGSYLSQSTARSEHCSDVGIPGSTWPIQPCPIRVVQSQDSGGRAEEPWCQRNLVGDCPGFAGVDAATKQSQKTATERLHRQAGVFRVVLPNDGPWRNVTAEGGR